MENESRISVPKDELDHVITVRDNMALTKILDDFGITGTEKESSMSSSHFDLMAHLLERSSAKKHQMVSYSGATDEANFIFRTIVERFSRYIDLLDFLRLFVSYLAEHDYIYKDLGINGGNIDITLKGAIIYNNYVDNTEAQIAALDEKDFVRICNYAIYAATNELDHRFNALFILYIYDRRMLPYSILFAYMRIFLGNQLWIEDVKDTINDILDEFFPDATKIDG
ncbi:hypothetical protein IJJ36_00770 [Candidatus Saccharibacteria bacterium]|nr:hypothetical protein [Candidatus Saccharibacteria bacterium]